MSALSDEIKDYIAERLRYLSDDDVIDTLEAVAPYVRTRLSERYAMVQVARVLKDTR